MSLHPEAPKGAEIVPTPDIMVDLETMGSRPGSVICAIGAVAFNAERGYVREEFYQVIDMASCQRQGLRFDAETIKWWLKQSDAARWALCTASVSLEATLDGFSSWWKRMGGQRIWGHGGNFDDPLLASAYKAAGIEAPWKFWDSRCTRTIFAAAGGIKPDRAEGVHHNALDDAKAQVASVIDAYHILGLRKAWRPPFPFEQFDECLASGLEAASRADAGLTESRRLTAAEVARAFDVPAHLLTTGDDVTPRQLDALAVLERLDDSSRFSPHAEDMAASLTHWLAQGVAGRDEDGFFLTPNGRTLAERLLA